MRERVEALLALDPARSPAVPTTEAQDLVRALLQARGEGADDPLLDRVSAALRVSEGRFRALVSSVQDAVFLTAPDGRTLTANEAACRMFGRTEEELVRIGRAGVCDSGRRGGGARICFTLPSIEGERG